MTEATGVGAGLSLRGRLLALIIGLLLLVILIMAVTLGWRARHAILLQAEADGDLIARVLAQAASVSNTVPGEVDRLLGQQMVAEALLAAHLFDLAGQAGLSKTQIDDRLSEITARTALNEIWGFDGQGRSRHSSLPDVDLGIADGLGGVDELARFHGLISGERFAVVSPSIRRSLDGREFKYAGVRGVGGAGGAALVGMDSALVNDIADRIGMRQMVRSLLDSGKLNAIWVFDHSNKAVAQGATGPELPVPSAAEQTAIEASIRAGRTQSWLDGSNMVVVTPIPGADGGPIGAALLRLPTGGLDALVRASLIDTAIIAATLLLISIAAGSLFANRLSHPLRVIREAAQAVEQQTYERGQLKAIEKRPDEFGQLARVFEHMAREVFARRDELDALVKVRTQQLSEKNAALETAQAQIGQELELAQHMQTAILPSVWPEDSRFSGHAMMRAARQVGGDFYDFFMLDQNRLAIAIGDVSGKGVPAAFFMAICRTAMQSVAKERASPSQCLTAINAILCRENPLELFVTIFYGVLDVQTGELRYVNAGHNPPYRVTRGGDILTIPGTEGIAAGIIDNIDYTEKAVTLANGDSLFLFTDGVTEAFDRGEQEFGERRLVDALRDGEAVSVEDLTGRVVASVTAFSAEVPQSDDITCLSLRYFGSPA